MAGDGANDENVRSAARETREREENSEPAACLSLGMSLLSAERLDHSKQEDGTLTMTYGLASTPSILK